MLARRAGSTSCCMLAGWASSMFAWWLLHICLTFSSSNAGQGSQCHPVGLGRHVDQSAILRKFPAIILGTECLGGNSKKHNYPRPHDYSLYYGAHPRISQRPPETDCSHLHPSWGMASFTFFTTGNHLTSGPTQQQTSYMSSAATHPRHAPEQNGANESHRRVSKPDKKTVVPNYSVFGI